MGNTPPRPSKTSKRNATPNTREAYAYEQRIRQITRKIEEKENICIAMQEEINMEVLQGTPKSRETLMNEISANLSDLDQIYKYPNIPKEHFMKAKMVKHNFEISLAKLKSVQVESREVKNRTANIETSCSGNPDLVKDLMTFDVMQNPCLENTLQSVEDEFTALKDYFHRSFNDVDLYCIVDKGVFYLQAALKNIDIPSESPLHEKKSQLFKELSDLRNMAFSRSEDIKEQQNFITKVNTLFHQLDQAVDCNDFRVIHEKALILREEVPTSPWAYGLSSTKENILKKLYEVLESTTALSNNGSFDKCPKIPTERPANELNTSTTVTEDPNILTDAITDLDENLYCNVEVIQQYQHENNTSDLGLSRATIYVNDDIIKNMNYNSLGEPRKENETEIKKRPLPLPRNFEETIINNLPRHWHKLNEILSRDSNNRRSEVEDIQKQVEIAKSLFERKINLVLDKCDESIHL